MMDYRVSRSFLLLNFVLHQAIIFTSLDQFFSFTKNILAFTDNFMVVSFDDIIGAFYIMKLAYRYLKIGNVLRVIRKSFFLPEPQFS